MKTKISNEVYELAKSLYVKNCTLEMPNDVLSILRNRCIETAKVFMDLEKDNLIIEDEHTKHIREEINRSLKDVFEKGEISVRTYNRLRYACNDKKDLSINDIIQTGINKLSITRGLGKKSFAEIDEYIKKHGLDWYIT